MNIFYRPFYRSEATLFINQLKADRPHLEDSQRLGRVRLWDQDVDRQAWDGYRAARVAQMPYVYRTAA